MSEAGAWFTRHATGAPEVLVARARHHVEAAAAAGDLPVDQVFASAGRRALGAAIAAGAGREAALDLLAADGLITLALLAAAIDDPGRLGERARGLRQAATEELTR